MLNVAVEYVEGAVASGHGDRVAYIYEKEQVLHVIPVGRSPHGLALFPQPGRYSLGHNGVYR